jgi:SAM-dependent methyltransferase
MTNPIANAEMAAAWDGQEGTDWARDWQHYDAAVRGHQARLTEAAAIAPGEDVLDVGCGNGESTRSAARAAGDGRVLGVDLSSPMLARARELATAEGLTNVSFEQADVQVHPFAPASFDVVISRFGAMFFADPAAAFANLATAVRPGGRLAMVVWQAMTENEWVGDVMGAMAIGRPLPTPAGAPGPFALAEPETVARILTAAGFDDAVFEAANEPFVLGTDAADAFEHMSTGGMARGMLQGLDDADRTRALDALRATMEAHDTGDGVVFGSATWIITARRPRPA